MNDASTILEIILPKEVYNYFEVKSYEIKDDIIHIYLDELSNRPTEYEHEKLISKGFTEAKVVQDYPLRDKAVYLHIRRRKWQIESSGQIITNKYDYVAKGTLLSDEFATFLKAVFRY